MNIPVMKLRPLFKMAGGKYYLARHIINHFPANYEDLKYAELCGGAASVLFNKRPSKIEIYGDVDPRTANVFYCLKHYPDEFIKIVEATTYCEKSFKDAGKVQFVYGDVNSAVAELSLRRMSRGGLKKHFSWSNRMRGGRPGDENAFETFKSLLPDMVKRLQNVEVSCMDIMESIKLYDSEKTLFYIDPPYVHSTRVSKDVYEYEMTNEQHEQIGEMLNSIEGKAIISGYDCLLYQKLYKNWRCVAKAVKNNAGQTKVKSNRIECLWLNY